MGSSFVSKTTPAFSLRGRTPSPQQRREKDTPGPGEYSVPSFVGHSNLSTIRSPPAFTLRARNLGGGNSPSKNTPSPIAYGNPSIRSTKTSSPSYSIGRRSPSPRRKDNENIGPNTYNIENITGLGVKGPAVPLRTAPAYSLRPRTTDPAEVAARRSPSPSPLEYTLPSTLGPSLILRSNGAFSIRGRIPSPNRTLGASPAPNTYVVPSGIGPQVSSTLFSAPSWGFGIGDRPATGMNHANNPGPADYNVPSAFQPLNSHSSYGVSLRGKLQYGTVGEIASRSCSPGPLAYPPGDVTVLTTHIAVRTPGLSKGARLSPSRAEREAAAQPPSLHTSIDLNAIRKASPSFSMRSRTSLIQKPSEMNGPAAYNLQGTGLHSTTKRNSPSWSLKPRWNTEVKDNGIPGPGAYGTLVMPFFDATVARATKGRSSSPVGRPGGGSPSNANSYSDFDNDIDQAKSRSNNTSTNRVSAGPNFQTLISS